MRLKNVLVVMTLVLSILWIIGIAAQLLGNWIDWNTVLTWAPAVIVVMLVCAFILHMKPGDTP